MEKGKISIITAAKSLDDPKLKELKESIVKQTYKNWEHCVVTEGDPESAKRIGLQTANGEFVCIVASDCRFPYKNTFLEAMATLIDTPCLTGAYSWRYHYDKSDPILNRYFALFGCNDPIPLYLGKCDRGPYYLGESSFVCSFNDSIPTLGDNGFFIRTSTLKKADIENYSHIDVCEDLRKLGHYTYFKLLFSVHHQTGDSLWQWAKKRLKYAESLNKNRRWRMVEPCDIWKIVLFGVLSMTFLEPTLRSLYGFLRSGIRDKAWFLHPIVCIITLVTYFIMCLRRSYEWFRKRLLKVL